MSFLNSGAQSIPPPDGLDSLPQISEYVWQTRLHNTLNRLNSLALKYSLAAQVPDRLLTVKDLMSQVGHTREIETANNFSTRLDDYLVAYLRDAFALSETRVRGRRNYLDMEYNTGAYQPSFLDRNEVTMITPYQWDELTQQIADVIRVLQRSR